MHNPVNNSLHLQNKAGNTRRLSRAADSGSIRPTYAGYFDLDDAGYEAAKQVVLAWLRDHATLQSYKSEMADVEFEINDMIRNGLLAQVVRGPKDRYLVVRHQHRERLAQSGRSDPSRNWRTEITIEKDANGASIATRQWFAGLESDVRPSRAPRFIKDLWSSGALSDLEIFTDQARGIDDRKSVSVLASLIADSERDFPVILLADGCPLDVVRLANDSIGFAHVVRLSRDARFQLISELDGAIELKHGALLTVYPRVDDSMPTIRAAHFETIIAWQFEGRSGPSAFSHWLHNELSRAIIVRMLNDPAHRTVESARSEAIDVRKDIAKADADLSAVLDLTTSELASVRMELEAAAQQLADLDARAKSLLDERTQLDGKLQSEKDKNHRLQQDTAALKASLASKSGNVSVVLTDKDIEEIVANTTDPENTFEAVENAERILQLYGIDVTFSDTSKEAAIDAISFKRPNDIQDALLRLGFKWNSIRTSGSRLDQATQHAVQFPCTMFESETTLRHYGNQRDVRLKGGSVVRLQKHLKLGGGGKDESARIYFGDRDGALLIGHVGRHLDVAKTS